MTQLRWKRLAGRLCALVILLGLSPARLDRGASARAAPPPSDAKRAPAKTNAGAGPWTLWKSKTTGNEYRVRRSGDYFYAEWANVPAEQASHGAYLRTRCRRQASKWAGTAASYLPCTIGSEATAPIANWCHLETRMEIDSLGSDRITGHGQTIKKVNCQQCKILEAGWSPFEWVLEAKQ